MPVHRPATACTCLPNNKYKCYFSSLYWPITFPSVLLSNFCAFSVNVRVQHPSPPQPPKTPRGLADRGGEGADDDAKGAEAGEDAQDAEDADEPQERHPRKRLYGQRKKRHCRTRARALEQATQELSQWSNRRSANGRPKAAGCVPPTTTRSKRHQPSVKKGQNQPANMLSPSSTAKACSHANQCTSHTSELGMERRDGLM